MFIWILSIGDFLTAYEKLFSDQYHKTENELLVKDETNFQLDQIKVLVNQLKEENSFQCEQLRSILENIIKTN